MRTIWKILTGILAAGLALVIALCASGCIYVAATQPLLKQEALASYMEKMDFSQVTQAFSLDDGNILSSILGKLMESKAVEDVVEDYLSGYVIYLLRGGADWQCTEGQIQALAAAAVEIAGEATHGLTDAFGDLAQSGFEVAVRAAITQVPAYSQINLGLDKDILKLVQNLLSEDMLLVFALLMAAAFLLIMLLRWSLRESLLFSGLGVALAGILAAALSFFVEGRLVSVFSATPLQAMLVPMVQDYFRTVILGGLAALAAALVCILIYARWTRKREARANSRKKSHAA